MKQSLGHFFDYCLLSGSSSITITVKVETGRGLTAKRDFSTIPKMALNPTNPTLRSAKQFADASWVVKQKRGSNESKGKRIIDKRIWAGKWRSLHGTV